MKAIALVSLLLSISAPAQGEPTNQAATLGTNSAPTKTVSSPRIQELNKASQLIGIEVWNPKEERLGTLKDVMVNLRQDRIIYAVLGTGGFLGFGDKLVALPPNALNISPEQKHLILHADLESLKAAPSFERNNWPEMANVDWIAKESPEYAQGTNERVNEAAGAESQKETNAIATDERKKGVSDRPIPRNLRISDLIGTTIRNPKGEKLGDVKDAALDLQNGKVLYVVVSAGGHFGSSEKVFAIPPGSFQASEEPKTLVLDATKETFTAAKGFKPESWPSAPDSTFTGKIEVTEPSGSPRPGEGDGRTALDQSNSRRDLMITQQLRRAIMRDDTMSVFTRNITIITADGRITVRGTVANQLEVDRIVAFAREIAGDEVTNELTVQEQKETKHETTTPKKE